MPFSADAVGDRVLIYWNSPNTPGGGDIYVGCVEFQREVIDRLGVLIGVDTVAKGVYVDGGEEDDWRMVWNGSIASTLGDSYRSREDFTEATGTAAPPRRASKKGPRTAGATVTVSGTEEALEYAAANGDYVDPGEVELDAELESTSYVGDDLVFTFSGPDADAAAEWWAENLDYLEPEDGSSISVKVASRQIRAYDEELECLEDYGEGTCSGPVEYHSLGSGNAFPRCEKHWEERLDRYESSIEQYADSDVAPSWFDPADAGERWDDDY